MKRTILILLIVVIIAIPLVVKYSKGESKADQSLEGMVMTMISSEEDKRENTKEVLKLLQDVDFKNFDNIRGEGSVSTLLEWLYNQDIEDEEDIINLINLIDEFMGKDYLNYLETVAKVYSQDKINFIKVLSKVPERTEDIANGLYNIRIYDRSHLSIFNDINMIMESEELTEEQKDIGIHLLNTYASCIT